jgi:benzoyl-CoA reductase/2-hydroxyglutaryl-CoA dehydratase subunit BcrC/BadD/HgdB
MRELLDLFGYDADEIVAESVRVSQAFERLGITQEDIESTKKRLIGYYDLELVGVRKMLGLYLRDMVDLVLARDEGKTKVIYAIMAEGFDLIASAFGSKVRELFVSWPESLFEVLFGPGCFDKLVPILEAAENTWLKAGVVGHCANVKALVGALEMKLIPEPDMLVVSGFLCETAPKTIDILHEIYEVPMTYFGTCLDREAGEDTETEADRVRVAAIHMREVVAKLEEVLGVEISDEDVVEQVKGKRILRDNLQRIHEMIDSGEQVLMSAANESIVFLSARLAANVANVPRLAEATTLLRQELEDRAASGFSLAESSAPRLFVLVPASFTDPRLEHLIEDSGMVVASTEIDCFWPEGQRTPPRLEGTPDVYEGVCSYLYDSKTRKLAERIQIIEQVCKRLNVDGVICRSHVGCRTIHGDVLMVKEALTRDLGLPAMVLEYESFDPRFYDHESLKSKFEIFGQMVAQ